MNGKDWDDRSRIGAPKYHSSEPAEYIATVPSGGVDVAALARLGAPSDIVPTNKEAARAVAAPLEKFTPRDVFTCSPPVTYVELHD